MEKEGHFMLWLLLAFCLGTLWEPVVELVEPVFTVDNAAAPPPDTDATDTD